MQTNNNFYKDNIFYLIIALLAFSLNMFSYHPILLSFGEYSPVRNVFSIIAFSTFIIIILSKVSLFFRNLSNIRLIPIYIFSLFITLFFLFIFFDRLFAEFYYFAIPFIPFIAGTCLTYNEKQIRKMFFAYSVFTAIVALSLVFSSGLSFEVSSTYLLTSKNSICVIWGMCAVGLFYFALSTKIKFLNICELVLSLCFCIFVLMGQGRAAMVATALIGFWIFLRSFKKLDTAKILLIMFSTIILALIFVLLLAQFSAVGDYIYKAFLSGRDLNDLDSLSSGRVGVYKAAIAEFISNPISGTLGGSQLSGLPAVHNYPLRMLYEYGLLFGFPFLLVYSVITWLLIKGYLKKQNDNVVTYTNLGFYLLGFIFIISMFEPTYPYTPGTVTAIAYFFFGYTLKATYDMSKTNRRMYQMSPPPMMPSPPMYNRYR